MRIWFDTEFYENGRTIDLISIGMVREDGETFYAEADLAPETASQSEWLKRNVKPHLRGGQYELSRFELRRRILHFAGEAPEFWAYFAAYDWVLLCQIFGRMIDLPRGWPMFVRDVQQWRAELGNPDMPAPANEHDALADALWTREAWERLSRMRGQTLQVAPALPRHPLNAEGE
ncbi:3'-5' exoribonuclease [Methylobacterium sp. DB1607]|nr:3'-5' exoribonuclease [Methylobacterium sp. DB1607]